MDMSIVIVTYNVKSILELSLDGLYKELNIIKNKYQSFLYEVIIIDNGTSSKSGEMIHKKYKNINYICIKENIGYPKGVNKGVKLSKGRYIVLFQPNIFFIEGNLLKIYEHMDEYRDVSVGIGKIADNFGRINPSRRKFPTILDDFFEYSILSKIYPDNHFFSRAIYSGKDENEEGVCHWGEAVFNIIREEDLLKIGYMDEDYFLFYADTDLLLRFFRRGYLTYYFPDSTVVYLEKDLFPNENQGEEEWKKHVYFKYKDRLIYYLKNYGFLKAYMSYLSEINFIKIITILKKDNSELKEKKEILYKTWIEIKSNIKKYKK